MKYHVLICDDDVHILASMQEWLAGMPSLQISAVDSGNKALSVVEKDPPDLIITDLNMPQMNGLELLQELAERSVHLPVIVVTGFIGQFQKEINQIGHVSVLEKPFNLTDLTNKVSEILFKGIENNGPFSFIDFLQLADLGQYSLNMKMELGSGVVGWVTIYKGQIWNARAGRSEGLKALKVLLNEPTFGMQCKKINEKPKKRTIKESTQMILLEFARIQDEIGSENHNSPSAPMSHQGLGEENMNKSDQEGKESLMANLNEICKGVVDDVSDSLACGVVDLNTGMLMGVHHTIPHFTQSYLDAVAAAAVELFRGKMVRRVEELLSKHRGKALKDSFQEIFINSKAVFHFMTVIEEKSAVVVLVTKKTTNQGMGWASLRSSLDDIKSGLP